MEDDVEDPDPRTVQALADAEKMTGKSCARCPATLCGHEAVFCLVLGYKGVPCCLSCIAAHMNEDVVSLRERALEYVRHHDCFLTAWKHAGVGEGFGEVLRPACLWNADGGATSSRDATREASVDASTHEASWDAGGMGCGDLVLELRLRLAALPPGGLLHLRATDPGAPADLPAWCAMTGHTLIRAQHPEYGIRRKG